MPGNEEGSRHILDAKPREGETRVDLDIGAGGGNDISESITEWQGSANLKGIFYSEAPNAFQSTSQSQGELRIAKENAVQCHPLELYDSQW